MNGLVVVLCFDVHRRVHVPIAMLDQLTHCVDPVHRLGPLLLRLVVVRMLQIVASSRQELDHPLVLISIMNSLTAHLRLGLLDDGIQRVGIIASAVLNDSIIESTLA